MKFGLAQHIIDALIAVFEQHAKADKAFVFGSRAKGNYRLDSDIDIAIKGHDITTDDIIAMSVEFEEKGITHKIDLINYDSIKEPDLKDHIDRVGIEFYSRWKEVKLGQLIYVVNGYAFKSKDFLASSQQNSLPVIKIKNVANGDVNLEGVQYHLYSDNLKKYVVEKNDILIALTGNHPELETQVVGLVSKFKIDKQAFLNQRVAKLLSNDLSILNNDYLYYFLKNKDTHLYLASQSSGSANQANISKTNIENTPISIPPIEEQTAIATSLSSLDDKIDLLHRQNKTLEQLAETLFRQWFVEEAEKDLGISDFMEINPREQLSKGSSAPYLEMKNVQSDSSYPSGWYDREFTSGTKFRNGDTLMARITPCLENGKSAYVQFLDSNEQVGWGSTEFLVLRARKEFHPFCSYLLAKNEDFKLFAIGNMTGSSGRQRVQTDSLYSYSMGQPTKRKLQELNVVFASISLKINKNARQIRTLTKTRDSLLPKLMSGEVRVQLSALGLGGLKDNRIFGEGGKSKTTNPKINQS